MMLMMMMMQSPAGMQHDGLKYFTRRPLAQASALHTRCNIGDRLARKTPQHDTLTNLLYRAYVGFSPIPDHSALILGRLHYTGAVSDREAAQHADHILPTACKAKHRKSDANWEPCYVVLTRPAANKICSEVCNPRMGHLNCIFDVSYHGSLLI